MGSRHSLRRSPVGGVAFLTICMVQAFLTSMGVQLKVDLPVIRLPVRVAVLGRVSDRQLPGQRQRESGGVDSAASARLAGACCDDASCLGRAVPGYRRKRLGSQMARARAARMAAKFTAPAAWKAELIVRCTCAAASMIGSVVAGSRRTGISYQPYQAT